MIFDYDFANRRQSLTDRLTEEYGRNPAYFTSNLTNIRYLTGFSGTAGWLLITPEKDCLFLDGRYRLYGEELASGELDVELYEDDRWDLLTDWLGRHDIDRLHLESSNLSYREFKKIRTLDCPETRNYAGDWVVELRSRKESSEREAVQEAVNRTLALFPVIEEWVEPGVNERELSRWIRRDLEDRSDGLSFDPLVLSGPRTARPHSPAGDRQLTEDDALLVDMGLRIDGYCSDLTRMFFTGSEHPCKELYRLSQRAAGRAFKVMEPGVECSQVASEAHDFLREQGYGDDLRHGLGHGVGLDVHEAPRLSERAGGTLEPGMVVTLEPGIYIDGTGGGRVEHNAIITENGAELLDEATPGFKEEIS